MPIFEAADGQLTALRQVRPGADLYEKEIEDLLANQSADPAAPTDPAKTRNPNPVEGSDPCGCLATSQRGAGGNRTPVHQALYVRATTIPDLHPDAGRPAGQLAIGCPVARESSFRIVIGLSRRQQSFPLSSPASGARLRWIGPVRHFWSRCLFAHLKIRRRERTARWQFCWLPRLASLSNSGRTPAQ